MNGVLCLIEEIRIAGKVRHWHVRERREQALAFGFGLEVTHKNFGSKIAFRKME